MPKKHSREWAAALFAAILILGGLSVFLWRTDALTRLHDLEQLKDYLNSFAPWSHLIFFLLQLSSVIFAPVPSNLAAMAGGACFGLGLGFLITLLAMTAGSLFTFTFARILGRRWAQRLVSQKLPARYQALIQRKRDSFLALVFLFPFFPDDLICILAGLTDIPCKRFAVIVLLTRPWGLLAASALGASLFSFPGWALPLFGIAGLLLFAFGLKYGDIIEERILNLLHR